MINTKQTLLSCDSFIDNEYLDKYCLLVDRNTKTNVRHGLTNAHHIIPKSWFKLNNLPIDNSLSNLVNLIYREHVLAHYYLCLCTSGKLQYTNELALICLSTRKKLNVVDKQLVTKLPLYNIIYENYCEHKRMYVNFYEDVDK